MTEPVHHAHKITKAAVENLRVRFLLAGSSHEHTSCWR